MGSSQDISMLATRIHGRLITPNDNDYDEARQVFYGGLDPQPAAIARVVDAADIATVINFTAETGLDFSVRSGGHSVAGMAVIDDAVVIDVRDLKGIEIDVDSRTVWAGSGLSAVELTSALGEHDLAVGFGDTGSVGIGGITLGGGVGFLSRRHGLTIDSLLAVEIVTASGEVIVVDQENHPDLFWAVRGGGGNFGVATRFRYALHPVDRIIGGMLIVPATPETVAGFLELSESAPDELTTIANVMSSPPMPFLPEEVVGQTVIMGLLAWCGDLDEGQEIVARFRSLAEPLADFVDEISYPEIYGPEDEDYRPQATALTGFTDVVDSDHIGSILEAIAASDAPLRVTQIRPMSGAIARVDADATAFAHRDRAWMINVASFYETPDELARRQAWVEDLFSKLTGDDKAGYVGFLADEGEERVRAAYPGRTWDRLREVKAKYDPDNRFHHNQNIPPA
jgi:FAD/FMN-containing dehydrogenase